MRKKLDRTYGKDAIISGLFPIVKEKLGETVTQQKVWEIFKETFEVIRELAIEKPVALPGIGTFSIIKVKPRGQRKESVCAIPRLKWRVSERIQAILDETFKDDPAYRAISPSNDISDDFSVDKPIDSKKGSDFIF